MVVRCFEDEKRRGAGLLSPKRPCNASSSYCYGSAETRCCSFSWSQQQREEDLWCENCIWIVKSRWVSRMLKRWWAACSWFCLGAGRWSSWGAFKVPSGPVFPDFVVQGQLCWTRARLSCWAEVPCDGIFLTCGFSACRCSGEQCWGDLISHNPSTATVGLRGCLSRCNLSSKKAAQMCITKTNLIETWK